MHTLWNNPQTAHNPTPQESAAHRLTTTDMCMCYTYTWKSVLVKTPTTTLGVALSRRMPSRCRFSLCLNRQLNLTDNWHWGLDVENSMMASAQLAHGEYDKYIFTDLKHKRTSTGHRHCLVFERVISTSIRWSACS